jgi:hypothetical protein
VNPLKDKAFNKKVQFDSMISSQVPLTTQPSFQPLCSTGYSAIFENHRFIIAPRNIHSLKKKLLREQPQGYKKRKQHLSGNEKCRSFPRVPNLLQYLGSRIFWQSQNPTEKFAPVPTMFVSKVTPLTDMNTSASWTQFHPAALL